MRTMRIGLASGWPKRVGINTDAGIVNRDEKLYNHLFINFSQSIMRKCIIFKNLIFINIHFLFANLPKKRTKEGEEEFIKFFNCPFSSYSSAPISKLALLMEILANSTVSWPNLNRD